MSARGRITSFVDADGTGRITLDDGTELRFGRSACVRVEAVVGLEVWVPETAKHPLGGLKAVAVHRDAVGRHSPVRLAQLRAELDAQLNARLTQELGNGRFDTSELEVVPHVDATLEALGLHIRTAILGDDPDETMGFYYEPCRLIAWIPLDPRFIAFGGSEGDAFGFFCEPSLLAEGAPPPIAFYDHEGGPLRYEAGTFHAFLRAQANSQERRDWLAARGYELDAEDVLAGPADASAPRYRALLASNTDIGFGDDAIATLTRLIAEMSNWPQVLMHRAELQLELLRIDQAHRAAVERIRREHRLAHPDVYPSP